LKTQKMPRLFYQQVRSIDNIDFSKSDNDKFYNFVVERPRELTFPATHVSIISVDYENMTPNVAEGVNETTGGTSNVRVQSNTYTLTFFNVNGTVASTGTVALQEGQYSIDTLCSLLTSALQTVCPANHTILVQRQQPGGSRVRIGVSTSTPPSLYPSWTLTLNRLEQKMLGFVGNVTGPTTGTFVLAPNAFNLSRFPYVNVHSVELSRALDRVKTGNLFQRAGEVSNAFIFQIPLQDHAFGQKLHHEFTTPLVFNVNLGPNSNWPQNIDIQLHDDAGCVLQNGGSVSILLRYENHAV
jgi:hypothetical protein